MHIRRHARRRVWGPPRTNKMIGRHLATDHTFGKQETNDATVHPSWANSEHPTHHHPSVALAGMKDLQNSEESNLQHKCVHQQDHNAFCGVFGVDVVPLQDGIADQATIL
eukprot:CAMPEP_0204290290 /NCGR_PEP_ID=MMETSP0468-20130131/60192_1 /ASSEMBLY_ACC=CAM_ASM_000383 /TAXON_ID=2969 /ORGANISM="Oxyrrhis marina" /LENGTH=109 /DNA_ID=CAMNT_0051268485 /DNA_START=14 /DNA_END=341 /DNA_ORIENTATION=-